MDYKFSIVIPCYNEEKNIPIIIEKFKDLYKQKKFELVLVNNGSTDNTTSLLEQLADGNNFIKIITIENNQGYGYGIISGLREASGEFIGWTHADLQTDPADVLKAFDIVENNLYSKNIFIKGNRKGRSIFDQLFTSGMSVFESVYLKKTLHDINAQPNIFSREFFSKWENPPYDFSLDLYALYMAKIHNLKIVRFNVLFPKRKYGQSSWNNGIKSKIKFIRRTIDFTISLKKIGIK